MIRWSSFALRAINVLIVALFSIALLAQEPPNLENGMKPYGSYEGGDFDTVSLTSGNLNVHIPIASYPQRGAFGPLSFYLVANSKAWIITDVKSGSSYVQRWITRDPAYAGLHFSSSFVKGIDRQVKRAFTADGSLIWMSYDYSVVDSDLANHYLEGSNTVDTTAYHYEDDNQNPDVPTLPTVLTDRRGIRWNFPTALRVSWPESYGDPDGVGPCPAIKRNPPTIYCLGGVESQHISTGASSAVDSNGNRMGWDPNTGVFTDTVGRVFTQSLPVNGCYTISFPAFNNQTGPVKICEQGYSLQTSFGVSGIQESNPNEPTNSMVGISSVTLANGTSWSVLYDGFGNISQITMPTGGTISYTWQSIPTAGCGPSGYSRAVRTRIVDPKDGTGAKTWTYSFSISSSGNTVTVQDPLGNQTIHYITPLLSTSQCSSHETKTEYFQSSQTGLQKVKTVLHDFSYLGYGTSEYDSNMPFGVTPKKTTTILDSGQTSISSFVYDTAANNSVLLQQLDYDYDGSLLKNTVNHYKYQDDSSYLAANLYDLPSAQAVYSVSTATDTSCGTGCIAQTVFGYDEGALQPSGVTTQRDTAGAVRGNQTSVKRWLNTSNSYLTSTKTYYDTGMPYQSKDPLQHTTTYGYDSTGTLLNSTTNALNQTVSAVPDVGTGLITSYTDLNNQTSTYLYNDSLSRVTSAKTPEQATTTFTYSDSPGSLAVTRVQPIDSSTSRTDKATFDGLGRGVQSILVSDGSATTKTTYDDVGNAYCVSNPYRGTSTDGSMCTTRDVLGRVLNTVKQDLSVSSASYSGNCATAKDETGRQRRSCSDALGRLIEVDEPAAAWVLPSGSGTLSISGGVQSKLVTTTNAAPGTATLTILGEETSIDDPNEPCYWSKSGWTCPQLYDSGWLNITVGGFTASTRYQSSSTASGLASSLASQLNGSTSPVTAAVSGTTLTVIAKATGTASNYALSVQAYTSDPGDFSWGPSFSIAAPNALAGGTAAASSTVYDSGTVTVTFNGTSKSAAYSQGTTSDGVAAAIADAFSKDLSAPVTATVSGSSITFVAKQDGSASNYPFSATESYNSSVFTQGSFSLSTSGSTFTGGNDASGTLGGDGDWVTLYRYDPLGNLTCVEQQGGISGTGCSSDESYDSTSPWRVRRFTYDSLSRLTRSKNPESGVITYGYNDDSVLVSTSNARGITINYSPTDSPIDKLHRVTKKTYSNGEPAVTYTYDQGTNGIGHRTGMTDASGSTSWTYDLMGRVQSETHTIGANSASFSYTYNLDNSLKTITYPSGTVISYHPNGAGRVDSVTDTAHSINYVSGATYTPAGMLGTSVTGAGSGFTGYTTSNNYNVRLQPWTLAVSSPSATVLSLSYDFHLGEGDNGNVYAVQNNLESLNPARPSGSVQYSYDALNRLTKSETLGTDCTVTTSGLTKNWGTSFSIDAWGNLFAINLTKCSAGMLNSGASDINNRFSSGHSYDPAGNMTDNGVYAFNAENQLISAASGGVTYTYDGDGQRVKKSTGTVYWTGSGSNILMEGTTAGSFSAEYVFFNGKRIARRDLPSGTLHYYFTDHLGSASIVANANGTVENESDYYPFGIERAIKSADSNHYKFTGKERDSETGLDYFGARYYASSMGRMMSPDWSAKVVPVPYAKLGDPQSLNLYSYVGNNPLSRIDRDGHEWQFNGNDKVTKEQLQKAFEAGVKSQGAGAWKAYEAIGKAKGIVAVGFGDLKSDTKFGNTNFSYTSQGGKLASVSGSITFNTNEKAINIGNSTDLSTAGSHEFTHVEAGLANPAGKLGGGLNNLAPYSAFGQEAAAFRNQDATAAALGGTQQLSPDTALSRSVAGTTGKTDSEMRDVLGTYGYHFDPEKPQ